MAYWSAGIVRMSNVQAFVDASNDWGNDRVREYGATDINMIQVVLGGEAAGTVQIGFEYPSIDAVLAGNAQQYSDPQILELLQDCGAELVRRSLLRTVGERGERTGAYATGLYVAHDPIDDETANSNLDVNWSHMQEGATGMAMMQIIAGGELTGVTVFITNTDSADSLFAASAKNFADPHVQKVMADSNGRMVGRVVGRRLL
jgi:hypothetical protein